jgi:hypothetical protein
LGVTPRLGLEAVQGQSRNLAFRMQHQVHSNWCWAAVATSVSQFYNRKSKWTQCTVAKGKLGRKSCCGKHVNGKCNKIGHLQHSLRVVGHAEDPPYVEGAIPFSIAKREIDAGRPVGVRTRWRGGEVGHFIAIVGYHSDLEMLTIEDPTYGKTHVHYRVFRRDYRGSGKWTHSYYTKG